MSGTIFYDVGRLLLLAGAVWGAVSVFVFRGQRKKLSQELDREYGA